MLQSGIVAELRREAGVVSVSRRGRSVFLDV